MADSPPFLIEFHYTPGQNYPPPLPAVKTLPEWIKAMSPEVPGGSQAVPGTVKKCPPFVDAMSCGYTIPLAGEVAFFMRGPLNLDIEQRENIIGAHPSTQFPGAPFANRPVVKFINPWIIKTPPGYSTLFVPLLNRFMFPFHMLAGFVETDSLYSPVHFPAVCVMDVGQRVVLPRGTPIMQAIPIKRESWHSQTFAADVAQNDAYLAEQKANLHLYKEQMWAKKQYT